MPMRPLACISILLVPLVCKSKNPPDPTALKRKSVFVPPAVINGTSPERPSVNVVVPDVSTTSNIELGDVVPIPTEPLGITTLPVVFKTVFEPKLSKVITAPLVKDINVLELVVSNTSNTPLLFLNLKSLSLFESTKSNDGTSFTIDISP